MTCITLLCVLFQMIKYPLGFVGFKWQVPVSAAMRRERPLLTQTTKTVSDQQVTVSACLTYTNKISTSNRLITITLTQGRLDKYRLDMPYTVGLSMLEIEFKIY